jgi:hypothetical protein
MHLNMDKLYNTPVQMAMAVAVLRESTKDYDISKTKLVIFSLLTVCNLLQTNFQRHQHNVTTWNLYPLHIWIPILHIDEWVVYCINLVHSRIDIFDTCCGRTEPIVQWHNTLKAKIPLVYEALCEVMDWKKHKMPNLTHFKAPFQHCCI